MNLNPSFSLVYRMPIYLLCPYIQNGISETLHQTCHTLCAMGLSSYIVYMSKKIQGPVLYQEQYPLVQEAYTVDDSSVVIFTEMYSYKTIESLFPGKNRTYLLWWFTIHVGLQHNTIGENTSHPDIIHLFHGDLMKEFVAPFLTNQQEGYYFHGYIDTDVFSIEHTIEKDDIIAYDPSEDIFSGPILLSNKYRTLPLIDLERKELLHTLSTCKVYVDLSPHIGIRRLPREAALLGCVVITNKFGSAAYTSDIGIPEKYKISSPKDVPTFLSQVLQEYDKCFLEQKEYREGIRLEEFRTQEQIKLLVKTILEPRGLLSRTTCQIDIPKLFSYKYTSLCTSKKYKPMYEEVATYLYNLCSSCSHITEMGGDTRQFTDIFLHTLVQASLCHPNTYYTYTYIHPTTPCEVEIYASLFSRLPCFQYKILLQDSLQKIPATEVLLINTWHVYGQLKREFAIQHTQVHRYIILTHTTLDRDTSECIRKGEDIEFISQACGFTPEEVSQGLGKAIDEFLEKNNHIWKKKIESPMYHGIVVLERIDRNTHAC